MIDLEQFGELERRHDPRLGGAQSRPYRELLAFAAGALIFKHGADRAAVIDYLRELLDETAHITFEIRGRGGQA